MPTSGMGSRIRAERERRGISLRALARDVGVSASMISQIETGKARPSVSTLYAITTALNLPVQDVFTDDPVTAPFEPSDARLGPHVCPKQRQVLTFDSGVTWERLGAMPPLNVDFLLVTYAPCGSSSASGDLMRHPGHEYGYIMSGVLMLTLGKEEIELKTGDAISFESVTPHRYRNESPDPAVGIWFVTVAQ